MFGSGYYDQRDDPFSLAFLGFINRMLRSTIATCLVLFLTTTIMSVGIWNSMVDFYVASNGVAESARIIDSQRGNRGEGSTIRFVYRYGHLRDNLRLIEPWWQNLDKGVGECSLITDPRSCREPNATVTVTYLPDSPGVYIVKGDRMTEFVRWIIIGFFLLLSMGAGWNLIRIGQGAAPLKLPSWGDWGYH